MEKPILRVRDVHAEYGKVPVLLRVSLEIAPGEVVALLGRNGAGKTTLLKSVLRLLPISGGQITWKESADLSKYEPHQLAPLGIAWVPQGENVFQDFTVAENLETATRSTNGNNSLAVLSKRIEDLLCRSSHRFLDIVRILFERKRSQKAGTLSGGEKQVLALARAIWQRPALLLLDEPLANLQYPLFREIADLLDALRKEGVAILVVEQRVRWALAVSDRTYILQKGEVVFDGLSSELLENDKILLGSLGIGISAGRNPGALEERSL